MFDRKIIGCEKKHRVYDALHVIVLNYMSMPFCAAVTIAIL